jgi:cytidylate kinase
MTASASRELRIVAVDGPAAAGKTTASLILASKYRIRYLESGRAYRLMAYLALRAGIRPDDENALIGLYQSHFGTFGAKGHVIEDGARYGESLRSSDVSRAVSTVSSIPLLRKEITEAIRSWATDQGSSIIEGRDIGTTVFPAATVKFYLTAAPEVRAQRRVADELGRAYRDVLADVVRRDEADTTRSASPLRPAPDSIVIDTSHMTMDQVISTMSRECTEAGLVSFPLNVTSYAH